MPAELVNITLLLPALAMVMARVAGLVIAVPVFSNAQIPAMLKVLLVFSLSLMVLPVVGPSLPKAMTLGQVAAGSVTEFLIGELLGLAAGVALFSAQMAGNIVSQQAGITLGQVFNPLLDEETSVLDQIWFFSTLMFFLAFRGHLAVTSSLLGSFRSVPPLALTIDASALDLIVGLIRSMFDVMLRLSGPAVLALLMSSLVMGFLTKTMPQLNILSVGFSVKIAIGLLVVAMTTSFSGDLVANTLTGSLDAVGRFWQHAAEGLTHGR